jgi:hypothetical protein
MSAKFSKTAVNKRFKRRALSKVHFLGDLQRIRSSFLGVSNKLSMGQPIHAPIWNVAAPAGD